MKEPTVKKRAKPRNPIDPDTMRAIEEVAERTAKRAVSRYAREMKELLLSIGVNANTPDGVLENQKDAAWVRKVRISAESTPAKISLALLGAGLSIVGGLIVYFSKHVFDVVLFGGKP